MFSHIISQQHWENTYFEVAKALSILLEEAHISQLVVAAVKVLQVGKMDHLVSEPESIFGHVNIAEVDELSQGYWQVVDFSSSSASLQIQSCECIWSSIYTA